MRITAVAVGTRGFSSFVYGAGFASTERIGCMYDTCSEFMRDAATMFTVLPSGQFLSVMSSI